MQAWLGRTVRLMLSNTIGAGYVLVRAFQLARRNA
jgi:hypothetical protein